jgi:hypothetical protein
MNRFTTLQTISRKHDISLDAFFATTSIRTREIKAMREQNFVPSFVKLMFMGFVEKEISKREAHYKERRDAFIRSAVSCGYKERNDRIEIPAFAQSLPPLEITAEFSSLVRFVQS